MNIQLHHQRHRPIRSQHDRTRAIPIPVIASNDQPTRHQQGEENSSAEEVQKQSCESEPVEFAADVDQACEAREGHRNDAEDGEEDGLGGAMGEEEGEADGPDDGEDAAEGAGWWAGEGVGVVLHCDGRGAVVMECLFSLCVFLSSFLFALFSLWILNSCKAAAKRKCKKIRPVDETGPFLIKK